MTDNKARIKLTGESVRLRDGGLAEVTDMKWVPLGDDGARAYRQVTYTRAADGSRPACKIVFEIRERAVVCASITLSTESKTGVYVKDLRAIKLDELGHDLYGYFGLAHPDPTDPTGRGFIRVSDGASFQRDRKTVEQAAKRRKITPEFVQQIAEVHRSAPAGERLQCVIDAFPASDGLPLSERQALRYIAEARKKGLLDD